MERKVHFIEKKKPLAISTRGIFNMKINLYESGKYLTKS